MDRRGADRHRLGAAVVVAAVKLDKVIRRATAFEKRLKACLRHGDFSGELAERAIFWIDTSKSLRQRLKQAKLKKRP